MMRWLFLFSAALTSLAQVADLKLSTAPIPMAAALTANIEDYLSLGIPLSWFCDSRNYCVNGNTCCPWRDNIHWSCAVGDAFATCSFAPASWNYFCPHNYPILCNHSCCSATSECVKGKCRRIRDAVAPSNDTNDEFGLVVSPQRNNVDWRPLWHFTGALYDFAKDLHETILSHVAARNRGIKVQQCWVIGYPKDLRSCHPRYPTKSCLGNYASLTLLDKKITIHNPHPPIQPAALQEADWCNDSDQINTLQFEYKKTYTTSSTVSLTKTVSKELGVSFEVGATFDIFTAKGTISAKINFSTSTQRSQTTTKSEVVSSTETIKVAPRSRTIATCWINEATVSSPFTMRIGLSGNVAWLCSMQSDFRSYAYPEESLWSIDGLRKGCASSWHMGAEQANEVWNKTITGTFTAVHGFNVECTTRSVPLKKGEKCKSPHPNEVIA